MPGRSPLDDELFDWENNPAEDTAVEDIKRRREAAQGTDGDSEPSEPKPRPGRRGKKPRARRGSASSDEGDGFDLSGLGLSDSESEEKPSRKSAISKSADPATEEPGDRLEAVLQVWHRSSSHAAKEYGIAFAADGTEYYCHQRSFADRENLAELRSFVDERSEDGGEVSLEVPISFRPGRRKRPDGRRSALEVSVKQFA